ncbi:MULTISPECIES: hypothetical protein [unclassified Blastococcus]
MRLSRVLLAGVAVAGIAATTSAFTAGNTVDASIAGFGANTVSGVTVTNIQYVPSTTDHANLAQVVFTVQEDVDTGHGASLTLRNGPSSNTTPGSIVGTYECTTFGTHDGTVGTITCNTAPNPAFTSFTGVGLAVFQTAP